MSETDERPDLSRGQHTTACYSGRHDDCGRFVPNVGCHCVCHATASALEKGDTNAGATNRPAEDGMAGT